MLTFAEEILLLLLDDDTGGIEPDRTKVLDVLLSGAILMDLAILGRIDSDLEKLFVVDTAPTGNDMLDSVLSEIGTAEETHSAQHWVLQLSDRGSEFQTASVDHLVSRGILKIVNDRFLWVFQTRRYPIVDDREEQEVKTRILDVLSSDNIPDPRDVALICLADAGAVFRLILNNDELARASGRIAQLRKMDLIGQAMSVAVRKLVDDIAVASALGPF